ncbi:MAG: NAD(P)H-dependent oxidoreductase [Rhodocyclaceae bacterium]|nr:NAD(P)H-dependent oxidoreductase [Rhodocyclaceae bacterium]MCA3134357.1 NAD(P)H-dependent oxidoreductase [Rhodocyclaceae bacterium]MCA3145079.1 NAD(P)H-dependent oxidoreductase [Rhodocyclaceae bacterium]
MVSELSPATQSAILPGASVRLLAFSGSLRTGSLNAQLVHVAAEGARAAGAHVTVVALRDYVLPLYDADLEAQQGLPANVRALKALFIGHDGLLIACPEYNGSLTAVLKNALDWVSRPDGAQSGLLPYEGKVAGLLSASPGNLGGLRAQDAVRQVLVQMGTLVVSRRLAVPRAHEAFEADGRLKDLRVEAAVHAVAAEVVRVVRGLGGSGAGD